MTTYPTHIPRSRRELSGTGRRNAGAGAERERYAGCTSTAGSGDLDDLIFPDGWLISDR